MSRILDHTCSLHQWNDVNGVDVVPLMKSRGPGFESWRVSDFSFVPLRPFFYAALAKRWKVQFRQWFAYFNNNVDSQRHIIIRTAILYIYIYSVYIHIYMFIYIYVHVYGWNICNVLLSFVWLFHKIL